RVAAEWPAHGQGTGREIGTHDRECGRNIDAAIVSGDFKRVPLEDSQLRPLVERLEVTNEPAADHVTPERDVVGGREYGGPAFTGRHFATPQNSNVDDRALGKLAKQLAFQVIGAIIERENWDPAQQD